MIYGLAGLIRLAFYNVKEQIRQNETSENRKYYQGMPITSISVILPILYMLIQKTKQSYAVSACVCSCYGCYIYVYNTLAYVENELIAAKRLC